ncbi:MAG: ADP-ribosylglycohydrolase family protein [Myxococcota bacterium]
MTRDRIYGLLLGGLIGDALGRPFEGAEASTLKGPLAARLARPRGWGHSDDAEAMLLTASSIAVDVKKIRWADSGASQGSRWADSDASRASCFSEARLLQTLAEGHEPARGYGKGMRAAFRFWRTHRRWQGAAFALWPEGSHGNGGAVRTPPIALLAGDLDEAYELGARCALPTHAHPEAVEAAALIAVATACALRGDEYLEAVCRRARLLRKPCAAIATLTTSADASRTLGNGVRASESMPLALWAARAPTIEVAIQRAILCGGDTDSIGAMAGALAGARYGGASLPSAWIAALEGPAQRSAARLADTLSEAVRGA